MTPATVPQGAGRPRPGARRRATRVVAALVALPAVAAGTGCEPACPEPYGAVAGQHLRLGTPDAGSWPVPDTARPDAVGPLDSDGDGVADEVSKTYPAEGEAQVVTVQRASGALRLVLPAGAWASGEWPWDWTLGDLDGDGRDELRVDYGVQSPEPMTTTYVVPGSTPDGEYGLLDVGVQPVTPSAGAIAMGDVDGDGRDDLRSDGDDASALVWLGADLDLDPGTAAATTPSHVVGGTALGTVPLDGRAALVLVTRRAADDPPDHEVTLWLPEVQWQFTTAGSLPPQRRYPVATLAHVAEAGGEQWLVVEFLDRYETDRYAWDLDDLCAAAP